MNLKVMTKLVVLLTALTATIVAIFWLKQDHMNSFWSSLGVDNSGQRLNWCKERVSSVYFYDKQAKLLEKNGKWLWAKKEEQRELDYLRVEKWFAKYCLAKVEKLDVHADIIPSPLFEVQFIDGERLTIHQYPDGPFEIQNQVYKSDSLIEGVKELLAFDKQVE